MNATNSEWAEPPRDDHGSRQVNAKEKEALDDNEAESRKGKIDKYKWKKSKRQAG